MQRQWAETVYYCRGLISFDATLCTGPRHANSPAYGTLPGEASPFHEFALATRALGPCAGCCSAPEGLTYYEEPSEQQLPLLPPPPVHSSNVKVAKRPRQLPFNHPRYQARPCFVARCDSCLLDRYCKGCHQWWCEKCYKLPQVGVSAPYDASAANLAALAVAGIQVASSEAWPEDAKVRQALCLECTLRARR